MHLASYHFDGDAETLHIGYEKMVSTIPDVLVNICVARPDGITVIDACPTRADFESFTASADFASILKAAGLPTPRIETLGDVRGLYGATVSNTVEPTTV